MRTTIRLTLGLAVAGLTLLPAGTAQAAYWVPVAYWHMEEGAGATTMVDSSGFGNSGQVQNVTTGTTGSAGYGYYFPMDSAVAVPHSLSLNPGYRSVTLRLDVQTDARVTDWNVAQKGFSTTPGGQYKVEIRPRDGGGVAACVWRGALGHAVIVGGPNVADGRWHHIVCGKYPTSVAMQVDYGIIYREDITVGLINNTEPMTIGSKAPGDDQYIGRIDEVTVEMYA